MCALVITFCLHAIIYMVFTFVFTTKLYFSKKSVAHVILPSHMTKLSTFPKQFKMVFKMKSNSSLSLKKFCLALPQSFRPLHPVLIRPVGIENFVHVL